jgi:DsbC/DsbD-like thiol-disulfide interchange protein
MRFGLIFVACTLFAQTSLNSLSSVVNVVAPEKVVVKRNTTQPIEFTIQVRQGYHVNSNAPADEYLIPLRWTFEGPVTVTDVVYPAPKMQKFEFSNKAMSVYEGDFKITAKVKATANAGAGTQHVIGKLRYQACNDRMCLPPRTLEVKVPVEIRN